MKPDLADYIEAGKLLTPDERELAALALQRMDESEQAEVDAAWQETVARRLDDLVSGRVRAVSGDETMELAQARAAARRR